MQVLLWDSGSSCGVSRFDDLSEIVAAWRPAEDMPALERIERRVECGCFAAGFISYEAAPGFDAALRCRPPAEALPLLQFGVFSRRERIERPALATDAPFSVSAWQPLLAHDRYLQGLEHIRAHLARGDTYQVNFTFPLRADFCGSSQSFFAQLMRNQRARYGAYIDTDNFTIMSASPELFFSCADGRVCARPMKGTAPRGRTWREDVEHALLLRRSAKDRAENVMIVDMLRNDLGRIALPGGVRVSRRFAVERYPTLLQMTSEVTARSGAPISRILAALFPCASVTGAPKVRSMEIIAAEEGCARGVYTGAIGFMAPGRRAEFSVAIRTVLHQKHTGVLTYGAGSGVVWDSDPAGEYRECLLKAEVLQRRLPEFQLFETILWERSGGFFLLGLHFKRLQRSARYHGFALDRDLLRDSMQACAQQLNRQPGDCMRVRLVLDRRGACSYEYRRAPADAQRPSLVRLSRTCVDSRDVMLYHKTTQRAAYDHARGAQPQCDDVLLWNENGEVTESTIANVVFDFAGQLVTPAWQCGLLPGVFREHLLARGEIKEKIIKVSEIRSARRVFLINSLRRWIPAVVDA